MSKQKKQVSDEVKALDAIVSKDKKEKEAKELTVKEVELAYADGVEYDRFRLQDEIKFYQEQAGYALIEIGKRLLRIKAHEEHGSFLQALEMTGVALSTARYAMSAANKFGNIQSIGHLGSTKVMALTVLDDTEVASLDESGEVFGMKLDDIDRMSTRELRKKLRDAREKIKNDKKSLESVIKQKEEKNNDLERVIRGLDPISKEKIAESKSEEIAREFLVVVSSIGYNFKLLEQYIDRVQSLGGISLITIEEFKNKFDNYFTQIEEARLSFFDNYDNAHVYTKEEQLEAGTIVSYGKDLKEEKRFID